jgi:MFS family permease
VQLRGLVADTRPFGNEHFRRLWLANVVTVVGAQLTVVAVPAQIYEITGSSAYVGLTGLFGLVPLVVFGLYGGALADVMDRRTLLVMTTVGLILTSGAFWLQAVLGLGNVWLLLGLFAVQQAFFAVNQPTRSAILPKLVPTDQLPAANSLNMTVFQAGGIAGPLVGGALIPVLGYSWLYLVDTVTLLATLAAVVKLPSLRVESPGGPAGWRSVVDGFRYLRGHPILLTSFLVDIIAMVFGMPRALFPEIAHLDFGGPESGGLAFALLFAAIPAGSRACSVRVSPSSSRSCCGDSPWSGSGSPSGSRTATRGSSWRRPCSCWSSAVRPTWRRRRSGSRCSRHPRATTSGAGSRASSSWWWPADRGWPTPCTVRPRPWSGPRRPRPGAACWSWC